jgi:gentisate 1,2-dioxygenase
MSQPFDPSQHYFVQRRRRFNFIEDWRERRRSIARGADVRMTQSATRRASVGFLAGGDSAVPMRVMDARIIEIAPGTTTSTHRHAHDAICFVLGGSGTSEVGGKSYEWSRFDALHTPAYVWHRHRNTGKTPARLLALSDAPLVEGFGLSFVEDIGDEPPRPEGSLAGVPIQEGGAYGDEAVRARIIHDERAKARRHTRFADVKLTQSPKGSKSALLVDGSLGYRTTGLSLAMFEVPPAQAQARHRHPGEAILYIVEGEGHSEVGEDTVQWKTGDAPIVNRYVWHQHFNDSKDRPAIVIRMHMWESVTEMMQACMDPVPLYEDEPALEARMREAVAAMER